MSLVSAGLHSIQILACYQSQCATSGCHYMTGGIGQISVSSDLFLVK